MKRLLIAATLVMSLSACGPVDFIDAYEYDGLLAITPEARFELVASSSGTLSSVTAGASTLRFSTSQVIDRNAFNKDVLLSHETYVALTDSSGKTFEFSLPATTDFDSQGRFFGGAVTGQPHPILVTHVADDLLDVDVDVSPLLCSDGGSSSQITTTRLFRRDFTLAFGTVESTPSSFTAVATFDGSRELITTETETSGFCQ